MLRHRKMQRAHDVFHLFERRSLHAAHRRSCSRLSSPADIFFGDSVMRARCAGAAALRRFGWRTRADRRVLRRARRLEPARACHAHRAQAQRFDQRRARADFIGAELARDASALEHRDPIGHVEHQIEVLLDDHDREPGLALEPRENLSDLLHDRRLHAFRGLVEQTIQGLGTSARAIARICCSPPDSAPPRRSSSGVRRGKRRDDSARPLPARIPVRRRSTRGADCPASTDRAGCRGPAAHRPARVGCVHARARA